MERGEFDFLIAFNNANHLPQDKRSKSWVKGPVGKKSKVEDVWENDVEDIWEPRVEHLKNKWDIESDERKAITSQHLGKNSSARGSTIKRFNVEDVWEDDVEDIWNPKVQHVENNWDIESDERIPVSSQHWGRNSRVDDAIRKKIKEEDVCDTDITSEDRNQYRDENSNLCKADTKFEDSKQGRDENSNLFDAKRSKSIILDSDDDESLPEYKPEQDKIETLEQMFPDTDKEAILEALFSSSGHIDAAVEILLR